MPIASRTFENLIEAQATQPKGADKRVAARTSVHIKVDVTLLHNGREGRTYTAVTRDLSTTGLGMFQASQVPMGQKLLVTIPRAEGTPILARCTVIHCSAVADGIYSVGAEFQEVLGQGEGNPAPQKHGRKSGPAVTSTTR